MIKMMIMEITKITIEAWIAMLIKCAREKTELKIKTWKIDIKRLQRSEISLKMC